MYLLTPIDEYRFNDPLPGRKEQGTSTQGVLGPSVPSAPSLAKMFNFLGCDGSVSQSDRVKWGKLHRRRVLPRPSDTPPDAVGE